MLLPFSACAQRVQHHSNPFAPLCPSRDPGPAGGAAEMFGPADRREGPAAAGPSGFLQKEVRDRDGILQEPGEAGRTLHG